MTTPVLLAALLVAAATVPPSDTPKPGQIAYCGDGPGGYGVHVITPDGKPVAAFTAFDKNCRPEAVRLSWDGTRVVVFVVGKRTGQDEPTGDVLVYDLAHPGKPLATLVTGLRRYTVTLTWGPDNATVYVNREQGREDSTGWKTLGWEITRYDVATGKGVVIGLPPDHLVVDVSPDGKTLLVISATRRVDGGFYSDTCLADVVALKPKLIGKGVRPYRFSPDGTRVVGVRETETMKKQSTLVVLDTKAGTEAEVKLGGKVLFGRTQRAAWSPDGTRLLVERRVEATGQELDRQKKAGMFVPNVEELITCAPDGTAVRPLLEKTPKRWVDFDWR